ncbi:hemolytic protein HlpA [Spirosoma daeguense]
MKKGRFSVPILFIIFNRLKETQAVFNAIRLLQPEHLFIAADGPRYHIVGEQVKCTIVREWVVDNVDWPCSIHTLFRDQNIGCGKGPSEAISWFFEHVEEGIILEDDCLPNSSFFAFCEELLTKYRNDERISAISGNNFQPVQPMHLSYDYYFSIFPSSWGWATWRRAWKGFDFTISSWPTINKKDVLVNLFVDKKYALWWKRQFDWMYKNQPQDMWDFQFHYHSIQKKQLAIIPKANLVSNIGHNSNGTHFQDPNSLISKLPTYNIEPQLRHPNEVLRNYEADVYIQDLLFGQVEIVSNVKRVKRAIKKAIQFFA